MKFFIMHPDAYHTVAAEDALDIPNDESRTAWDDFVAKVNVSLDNLDLEFRHLHDELTGRAMYALVRSNLPITVVITYSTILL